MPFSFKQWESPNYRIPESLSLSSNYRESRKRQPVGAPSTESEMNLRRKLITCRLEELRPHPSYARHGIVVPVSKLSVLIERGDLAFRDPIAITRERTILDGYARVEYARQIGWAELLCLEYELSETEALQYMLKAHQRSQGFNTFQRIVLTLDLEPELQDQARLNQRAGGQYKGSSKLTEAKRLDVRSKLADIAGVSMGNVSKVKFLVRAAHDNVLAALRSGEVSIHRAWTWSQKPLQEQQDALWWQRTKNGLSKTTRELVSRHRPKVFVGVPDPEDLANHLFCASTQPNEFA